MLSLICNRASICKQSVKALMGISTEFYSDKIDINFIDVNAKSLWPFSTFVNQVLTFLPSFCLFREAPEISDKIRRFVHMRQRREEVTCPIWHRNHCCICSDQADLSLRWAHMPFRWFSHEAAQIVTVIDIDILIMDSILQSLNITCIKATNLTRN